MASDEVLALRPTERCPARIDSPDEPKLAEVEQRLTEGEALIVQFAAPAYTPALLAKLDSLCLRFGERLEVRFYGHMSLTFDASTLASLPNVANLAVDCLRSATGTEALADLPRLRRLSLGIAALDDAHVLRFPNLRKLRTLFLSETKGRGLELSYLAGMEELGELLVSKHDRGLALIKTLPRLWKLRLHGMGKDVSLSFVSEMRLRWLSLVLGGRTSIADLQGPALEALEITRVRGLSELGDLSRFGALRMLVLDDQPRITALDLGHPASALEELRLLNCKGLARVDGLASLSRLRVLAIVETAMGPDALRALPLPAGLATCVFATAREKENRALRQELEARGYASA